MIKLIYINLFVLFQGEPDCWVFIQGLSWLAPSLAQNSPSFLNDLEESLPQLPPSMNSKAMIWLYKR